MAVHRVGGKRARRHTSSPWRSPARQLAFGAAAQQRGLALDPSQDVAIVEVPWGPVGPIDRIRAGPRDKLDYHVEGCFSF